MESCLLCLDINKDVLDCIRANSVRWQELNILKIIEKHFWSMITIQPSSWICSSCWRVVDCFHKFYLQIEEAHINFGKIKMEEEEQDKNSTTIFFLESEKLGDQSQLPNFMEPEILLNQATACEKSETTMPLDELDFDDMPLKNMCKQLRLKSSAACRDPLKKPNRFKARKKSKRKLAEGVKLTESTKTEETEVKEEPEDSNDIDSEILNDNKNDGSDASFQPDKDSSDNSESEKDKACKKQSITRKQNDKFIVEHFRLLDFKFICDLCQVPFVDFSAMQKHFSKTHQQRGYVVCCARKFFDRSRLIDHLHWHVNPDHFKCKDCGKVLSDRITFDNHLLRVHRANEVVRQHFCDVCGKSFAKACVLKIHKLTHLSEEEKKIPCSECGKNYATPYVLKLHKQAVHLKRFVKICNICGKAINSSAEFKIHMNKHEGILPVFNCDICGLRLTSERGLKLHKVSQHPVGGKQEHQCPICPKISPTPTALRKHINTMHVKGYDHKCSICEKAFRKAETLKEHMASHTGTFLYTCPWCPKTFNSNGNMHAHRKNKHPKEYLELKLQRYN